MNLLITGAFDWESEELVILEQMGHRVVFMQQEKEELPCTAASIEGVICNGLFLRHSIEQFTSLRYIQLTSAGFDRVPMDYVKSHGISIFNARGVYSIPMAEFVVSGVLELYKKKRFFYEKQKAHIWEKHRGLQELYGKNVCIVGCGSVGSECAKRFKAFDCNVVGIDIMPYQSNWYEKMLGFDKLDEEISECDIIILTLPLAYETKGLINKERLSKIKDGSILVNVARGALVDQTALIKMLECNRIMAVLDVFDTEPLDIYSPLWDMENVIITPHNSFVGDGNHKRMISVILNNLEGAE
jgi:phosphoglycerate dehydrogenase-like enzyme